MCDQWRKMLVAIYYDAAAVSEEIAAALFYFPESSRLQCVFPPLHWLWMIYEVKIHFTLFQTEFFELARCKVLHIFGRRI